MSTSIEQPAALASGAAGAAQFAGWDSRKYNYFEPKGRKASHYEDMTVDVQPDPKRYLLQDWIISFADGTPTYSETWTAAKCTDWHKFRAVDEEWERTHYQRQSTIVGMISGAIGNARRSGAVKRFDKTWLKVLEQHLGAYKHAEFGLGTATMHAQRYGVTQMINSAILTNASYKLRFAQDLTLYLGEIALDAAESRPRRRQGALADRPDLAGHAPGDGGHRRRHRLPRKVFRGERRIRAAGGRPVSQRFHHADGRIAKRFPDAYGRVRGRGRL